MNRITIIALLGFGLAGCTATQDAMPDGQNRVIDIVNDTAIPVMRAYGRAKSGPRKVIGEVAIASRGYATINFANPTNACIFDLVAEFQADNAIAKTTIDVCTSSVWRIHE